MAEVRHLTNFVDIHKIDFGSDRDDQVSLRIHLYTINLPHTQNNQTEQF